MFDRLRSLGAVDALARQATEDIAAVHRRPVNLRRSEVTASESALRGARSSALIDAAPQPPISAYGVLAPGYVESITRTWLRAPLQVLARLDVLSGGDGVPQTEVERLHGLRDMIVAGEDDALLPQVVHAEIAAREVFGERSGTVARVAGRIAAIASGFDPRGLAVPEPYLYRHRAEYHAALAEYARSWEGVSSLLELLLWAWIDGAREAESIAAAA
ncbi:hypothetical protein [Corynebacterium lowii]|uniref:Oxidoreductase n=1 Tax=Corynebacterium lowii TaxID=1544413 RepID=A0A0Q0ZB71_9CORY|nr:hypothetical protein [Corynebacterium lowii]KQB87228.1 hypothetical protein Clow_00282 [Corynebacterium lowii]MDP9852185.1 hypothetical protein [Corynebacterium lowii]